MSLQLLFCSFSGPILFKKRFDLSSVLLLDPELAPDGLVQELFLPNQGALARDSVIICELLRITDEGGPQCLLIRAQ